MTDDALMEEGVGCWGRNEEDSTKAYVMAGCAFMVQFVVLGGANSFGIFMDQFEADTSLGKPGKSQASIIVSIANGMMPFIGAVMGRLVDRYGPTYIQTGAGVALFAGLFASSWCRNYYLLMVTFGGLIGLAGGCTISPGLAAVGKWFDKDRSVAFGIVYAGSSAGTTVIPFIAQQIKAAYGDDDWRAPFRWLSLASIPGILAGLIMRPRTPPVPHSPSDDIPHLKLKQIITNNIVVALFSAGFLFAWGFFSFLVYAVAYAQASGDSPYTSRDAISDSNASYVLSCFGATQTAGNVIWGLIARKFGNTHTFALCNFLCGACFVVWPWCAYYWSQMLFGGVFGFTISGCLTCYPSVIADHFAGRQLGDILSTIYLGFGVGGLVGPPVTGLLVEWRDGDFMVASFVCAACYGLCVVLMVCVVPADPTAMERFTYLSDNDKLNTIDSSPISPMYSSKPKFDDSSPLPSPSSASLNSNTFTEITATHSHPELPKQKGPGVTSYSQCAVPPDVFMPAPHSRNDSQKSSIHSKTPSETTPLTHSIPG